MHGTVCIPVEILLYLKLHIYYSNKKILIFWRMLDHISWHGNNPEIVKPTLILIFCTLCILMKTILVSKVDFTCRDELTIWNIYIFIIRLTLLMLTTTKIWSWLYGKSPLDKVYWSNVNIHLPSCFLLFLHFSPLPSPNTQIFIGSLNHSTRLINVVASNKLGSSDRRMSIPVSVAGDLWLVTAGPAPWLVLNHQEQLI